MKANKKVSVLGREVTATELAKFFGVTIQSVNNWRHAGCPVVRFEGNRIYFNTLDVFNWKRDREIAKKQQGIGLNNQIKSEDRKALERRKLASEVALAELKLKKTASELIPIQDARQVVTEHFEDISKSIKQLPGEISKTVIGIDDEMELREAILDKIDEKLLEISNDER